jgi:hypothetical protein
MCPDRLWGQSSLLLNDYRGSFRGIKRPGPHADHPPPSSGKEWAIRLLLLLHIYTYIYIYIYIYRGQGQLYLFIWVSPHSKIRNCYYWIWVSAIPDSEICDCCLITSSSLGSCSGSCKYLRAKWLRTPRIYDYHAALNMQSNVVYWHAVLTQISTSVSQITTHWSLNVRTLSSVHQKLHLFTPRLISLTFNIYKLQGCVCTSQGCVCTSQGCVCTSQGCVCTSQGCVCTSQGCVCTSQGCVCTSQGCVCTSQDCVCTSPIKFVSYYTHFNSLQVSDFRHSRP